MLIFISQNLSVQEVDSAQLRQAVMGVARPYMRSVFPVATPTGAWRQNVGLTYPVAALSAPGAFDIVTRNDDMRSALLTAGFTGTLDGMLLAWLAGEGYTSGDVGDRWLAYLDGLGYTTGTLNDRKLKYYRAQGADASATLSEAEAYVWANTPPT